MRRQVSQRRPLAESASWRSGVLHSGHTRMSRRSFDIGIYAPVVNLDFSKRGYAAEGGASRFGTVGGTPPMFSERVRRLLISLSLSIIPKTGVWKCLKWKGLENIQIENLLPKWKRRRVCRRLFALECRYV